MVNLGLLILRATVGSLLAGHGAQKLFGSFGGHGFGGTTNWLESMGFRPGKPWAAMAGVSEFGGGILMVLGFLNPVGPLLAMGSMLMATIKVHAGKPVWVTAGGPELTLTNMAAQAALIAAGPGALSLDRLLGTRLPRWIAIPGIAAVAGSVWYGLRQSGGPPAEADRRDESAAGAELEGGVEQRAETFRRMAAADDRHPGESSSGDAAAADEPAVQEGVDIAAMRGELP
ncbi:MAG: DoxX family protein [Chloroflexota bacterium]